MKKLILFILLLVSALGTINATAPKGFDPARFEADLEQFITTEACLSPTEASAFFPLYREMRKKQFAYFSEDRRCRHVDTSDDKACAEAINRHDENDIAMKKLQQAYHKKFMKVLPASKVYLIMRAEEKFHRRLFMRGEHGNKKTRK